MEIQTEGFIVVGELPNDEHYHCLICRQVPDVVMVDVFVPDPKDIPLSIAVALPDSGTLVLPYRLCPQCSKPKPDPWKIRLLMLERMADIAARSGQ